MNGEPGSLDPGGERATPPADAHQITQLLSDWSHGDAAALEKLIPLVYEELRRLAHRYMEGQARDHTLQTTALVNEAYLRLADQSRAHFTNRSHFLAVAAKAMRQILVDRARAAQRQKRGGGASRLELDEAALVTPEQPGAILALNDALERLATLDSRAAQAVELRYFGGLKQEEIAEVLKVSTKTVRRDWGSRAGMAAPRAGKLDGVDRSQTVAGGEENFLRRAATIAGGARTISQRFM